MERFTIQCTTCKVRLNVNDESVIGAILACPKCGSMVQVVPPVGWQRVGDESETKPQPTARDSKVVTPTATNKTTASHSESKPKHAAAPPAPIARPPALPKQASSTFRAMAPSAPAAVATGTPSPEPPEVPAADEPRAERPLESRGSFAALWRDWGLLGGGIAGGVLLGAVLWLALRTNEPVPLPSAPVVAVNEVAVNEVAEMIPQTVEDATQPEPAAAATDATNAGAIEPASPPAVVQSPAAAEVAKQDTAVKPSDKSVEPPQADVAATPAKPAPAPTPAIRLEPLRNSAAKNTTAKLILETDQGTVQNSTTEGMPALPPASRSGEEAAEAAKVLADAERAAISEKLTGELSAVRITGMPLAQFAEFIGDLTGLTLSIDDASLAHIGKSRKSPVTFELEKTTAGGALKAAVKQLGLKCMARDGQVVITAAE